MTSERASTSLERLTLRERLSVLGIWTGLGLLESAKAWIARRFSPQPVAWSTVLVGNLPWWLMWAVLTPLAIALARRVRPERGRLAFAAIHFLAAVLLSLLHHTVVGTLYYYTHTRGNALAIGIDGELVTMTLGLQFRNFFTSYFVVNVLTYFAVIAAYYGLDFYKRYRQGELRAARLEAGMHQARLAALRMELNPHFLFNTLNAVAGLVRRSQDTGAIDMLARLSALLRATLEQADDPEIPLDKELELLGMYLEIERVRFGGRLEVDVVAEADAQSAMVPPFILQPLVENAVRHGVARNPGPGRVQVLARVEQDELVVTVTNTGPVIPPSAVLRATREGGIGLANARQRLAELYGSRADLVLEALPQGGARAVIRLPRIESGADAGVAAGMPDAAAGPPAP